MGVKWMHNDTPEQFSSGDTLRLSMAQAEVK